MKGIIIYEKPWWDGIKGVTCCEFINDASYELKNNYGSQEFTICFKGKASELSKTKCSPKDIYDFETGALIALMKMCGREKALKAVEELYFLKEPRNEKLEEENKELHENIDELFESDKYWKSEAGRLSFEKHRLEEKVEKLKLDCEKLQQWCNQWSKPPTKRGEMWAEIFAIHKKDDVIIKVKKEDINAFLHEIEKRIPEITWVSGVKMFEAKRTIGDIYDGLKIRDTVYFRLQKSNKLSYSTDPDVYRYKDLHHIDYLPPMRWDLFKKGRRIIRVTPDKLDEFMTKCSNELGGIMKPALKRYKDFTHVFVMISDYHYDNKATVHIMSPEDLVRNQHENPKKYSDKKIVDWEDVR